MYCRPNWDQLTLEVASGFSVYGRTFSFLLCDFSKLKRDSWSALLYKHEAQVSGCLTEKLNSSVSAPLMDLPRYLGVCLYHLGRGTSGW